MNLNEISYQIRGSFFTVCNELVPGLLENVYTQALIIELQNKELQFQNAGVQSSKCGSSKFFSVASVTSVVDKKIPKILKNPVHSRPIKIRAISVICVRG